MNPSMDRPTHRFFVSPECLRERDMVLEGPLTHQIARVLRLRVGARIALLDDSGWEYLTELDTVAGSRVTAHIVSKSKPVTEPATRLVLYQATLKGKRFDWVLQKGTELGVGEFVPLVTRHCVASFFPSKLPRWRQIVREAAEQSGRTRLPPVRQALSLERASQAIPEGDLALLAWVGEGCCALAEMAPRVVSHADTIHLFVGPEGGFDTEEVMLARERGMQIVSLGPRILRAETAPIVASALILAASGDLSSQILERAAS